MTEQPIYHNKYECPACGHQWSDDWCEMQPYDCEECQQSRVTPYSSEKLTQPEKAVV